MDNDIFEVKPCPMCGKAHRYPLIIKRSKYLFGAAPKARRVKQMRRLLVCPKTSEMYEAVLELSEDERGMIAGVSVGGVIEEVGDGSEK